MLLKLFYISKILRTRVFRLEILKYDVRIDQKGMNGYSSFSWAIELVSRKDIKVTKYILMRKTIMWPLIKCKIIFYIYSNVKFLRWGSLQNFSMKFYACFFLCQLTWFNINDKTIKIFWPSNEWLIVRQRSFLNFVLWLNCMLPKFGYTFCHFIHFSFLAKWRIGKVTCRSDTSVGKWSLPGF